MGEKEGRLSSLSVGDYRAVLEFVASALRTAGPAFPDVTLTSLLCDMLDAHWAGAGEIDLRGKASRRWADTPVLYPLGSLGFHETAIDHPLTKIYRRSLVPVSLRLSDYMNRRNMPLSAGGTSDLITIPLTVTPQRIAALALMRTNGSFALRQLSLAQQLRPILAEIYSLEISWAGEDRDDQAPFRDQGIPLSGREIAVLDLMAGGLIAHAIASQLNISARTVGKHIESIYRKLDTHDRTSAILRAQALGLLPTPPVEHRLRRPATKVLASEEIGL